MRDVDSSWFDWMAVLLDNLAMEIRQKRGREPDSGDLLIVLASASDTVASDMMRELGLDADRLADVVEGARRLRAAGDPSARIEKVRQDKEAALGSEDPDLADRFRDEERNLTRKLKGDHAAALYEIRVRLGLVHRDALGD
jgi:hypothetical protein